MRFATISSLAFMAFVNAGDGTNGTIATTTVAASTVVAASTAAVTAAPTTKAGKNAKGKAPAQTGRNAPAPTSKIQERNLAIGSLAASPVTFAAASPVAYATATVATQPISRTCAYNNCNSCTNQIGCYWTSAGCSNIPCSVYGFCAIAPAQCGGCQQDSQCGNAPRRCENGQCVGVEGDRTCDYYRDCAGCLSRPNCLWDPNTIAPTCKPKEQCDFTYRGLALGVAVSPTPPPATACVRTLDRCSQQNFNGAQLDLNNQRGVGCTNHGQCRSDQYCFSCSKCSGGCAACKAPGVPVSGICGPAWRCPIDNDSISLTCPIVSTPLPTYPLPPVVQPVPSPVVVSCSNFQACGSCTATNGCVWSGSQCYYSTVACSNVGCANTPNQCRAVAPIAPVNCAFNNCQNCAGTNGCAWSGSFCYYAAIPCNNPGCANTASQCPGCTSNSQCGAGRRCEKGACLQSAGDYSCDYYTDCGSCLSNANCLWDPNELLSKCKPASQCDFTYRGLALGAPAPTPAPATACVRTLDKCAQTNFNGAVLDPNAARGAGCTNHGQCRTGEYCFSCSKCRGNCSPCFQNGASVSGACAPASQCPIDLDSINDLCPVI